MLCCVAVALAHVSSLGIARLAPANSPLHRSTQKPHLAAAARDAINVTRTPSQPALRATSRSCQGDPSPCSAIIGSTMTEITEQFRVQGLAERQFLIVRKIERHRFIRVDGENTESMFGGEPRIAATFRRDAKT